MRALRTNPIDNQCDARRQITTGVDRQTAHEFDIICRARGVSKAEYLREVIEAIVEGHLSQSALRIPPKENGNAEPQRRA